MQDAVLEQAFPKINALYEQRKAAGQTQHPDFNFLIGDPNGQPPEAIIEAEVAAAQGSDHGYGPQPGRIPAREAIAENVLARENIKVGVNNIFVANGSKPILSAAINKLSIMTGRVGMLAPYYAPYIEQAADWGRHHYVHQDPGDLADCLDHDSRMKLAIITTPNNPDGSIMSKADVTQLYQATQRYGQILVIDEAYKDYWYGEDPFASFASEIDIANDPHVVAVRSFSKSLNYCGMRIGYAIGCEENIKKLTRHQSQHQNPAPARQQWAIADGLNKVPEDYYTENRTTMKLRLEALVGDLDEEGIGATMPDGAFYLFLDVSQYVGDGCKHPTAKELCWDLAENHHMYLWPGNDYGVDDHLRISVAGTSEFAISRFVPRFADLLKQQKA